MDPLFLPLPTLRSLRSIRGLRILTIQSALRQSPLHRHRVSTKAQPLHRISWQEIISPNFPWQSVHRQLVKSISPIEVSMTLKPPVLHQVDSLSISLACLLR